MIAAHFETEDNVIPASNSVMGKNLFQLCIYFENSYYEKISQRMLHNIFPTIEYPSAYSNWMDLALNNSDQNKELAICGDLALEYCNKINGLYFPNIVLAGASKVSTIPFLKNRFVTDQTTFYLCQNKTCSSPSIDFQQILSDLDLQ